MKIIPIKITLLSPLFNYCLITSGGCITSNFIGDLALTYALNRVRWDCNFYTEFKKQPSYEELNQLPYTFTVAKPDSNTFKMTGIYIRNTLFNTDGFTDMDVLSSDGSFASGKSLFKNFFKVQGVKPESTFSTCLIAKDSFRLELPLAVRLGTGRECLALLEKSDKPSEIWLNAFTLKKVYGNFIKTLQVLKGNNLENSYHFEFKLENYILVKSVKIDDLKAIFEGVF
jgi:CRISPR-associated protein Csc1